MNKKFAITVTSLLALIIFFGCNDTPENLTTARQLVKEYYESGKFEEELISVIVNAKEEFDRVDIKDNSVVLFDVDETALDNYELAKSMGFGYVYRMNKEWNAEMKSPAIAQVKELYDFLISKGARIIFLTGRNIPEYEVTYGNLIKEGYTKFDTLITQRKHEYKMKAQEFKSSKRKELVEKGYDIIGTVGDQWSDIEGPHHGIQVKIPNYLYLIED
jgi:predicted secreted acid phosphatase